MKIAVIGSGLFIIYVFGAYALGSYTRKKAYQEGRIDGFREGSNWMLKDALRRKTVS